MQPRERAARGAGCAHGGAAGSGGGSRSSKQQAASSARWNEWSETVLIKSGGKAAKAKTNFLWLVTRTG